MSWSPPVARKRRSKRRRQPRIRRRTAADAAFVSALNEILLIAAIVSFVGAALGFFLARARTSSSRPSGPAESAAA